MTFLSIEKFILQKNINLNVKHYLPSNDSSCISSVCWASSPGGRGCESDLPCEEGRRRKRRVKMS